MQQTVRGERTASFTFTLKHSGGTAQQRLRKGRVTRNHLLAPSDKRHLYVHTDHLDIFPKRFFVRVGLGQSICSTRNQPPGNGNTQLTNG
jgi:hypothetical protein